MAKYQRQATNKYYGAGSGGYVSTGKVSDELSKSLTNAGYKIGDAETLRIDRKKDEAIAKIDELYANGKSFETIQSEIISGKHPELTGKYIKATTNYHAGRVKAHEVIAEIKANKDKYDITDTSTNLDIFYKQYMPDTKAMDSSTLLGFTTQFNKFRAKDALDDADNRAAYATERKITDGVGLLDDIPIENLKKELPDFIKGLQIPVPNSDGTSNSNLLHTNEETLNIVKRSIVDIIANAKTEDDLERADILLNTNLGYSKNGSAIGTIASRKSKDVLAIQKELEKTRDRLEKNDRDEEEYQRKEEVKNIYAKLFAPVKETDQNGNVTERKLNHEEKMALRDRLEAMGDVQAVANFDKMMKADNYIDTDPAVYDDLVERIYNNDFFDEEEMKTEFNKLNVDPELMKDALSHFETAEKSGNRKLHLTKEPYTTGTENILEQLDVKMPDEGGNPFNKSKTIRAADKHIIREIYDFERDFFEREGKKPDNFDRADFMDKLEKYMVKATTRSKAEFKTFDQQEKDAFDKNELEMEKALEIEEQKQKDNTVISTTDSGEELTLGGYVDNVMENLNTIDVPKLRKTIIEGIISEDEKYRQQTLPKITKYIENIVGTTFNADVMEMMSTEDYQNIVRQVASNLKITTGNEEEDLKAYQQIDKIFQSLIGG